MQYICFVTTTVCVFFKFPNALECLAIQYSRNSSYAVDACCDCIVYFVCKKRTYEYKKLWYVQKIAIDWLDTPDEV
jgi:hypothetical protein